MPECVEAVNVALLILDSRPRIVSDFKFEKLSCVAPSFDRSVLQFWLECASAEIANTPLSEVPVRLASRSAQVQIGEPTFLRREITESVERKLVHALLRRMPRPTEASEEHIQYVDSLISDAIGGTQLLMGEVLKRAKPSRFLKPQSLKKLDGGAGIKFSRVLVSPTSLVLMDGVNLAASSKMQLRQRAAEIDFGFFSLGAVRTEIEEIEQKKILRTAFVFNTPPTPDREIQHVVNLVTRDSDLAVDSSKPEEVFRFNRALQAMQSGL